MIPNVTVGYPHMNDVHAGFAFCMAEACLRPNNRIIGLVAASSPRQEISRNLIIEMFLEGPGEWLMWIDTDMTFGNEAIARLQDVAERQKADMVAGLGFIYKRGTNEIVPNAYFWDDEEKAHVEFKDYKPNKVYEVDAAGSGFVLVNRRVFEAWGDKFWHKTWTKHPANGREMGHDLAFSYRATQELGFKLLWDTTVKTGHIKYFELREEQFEAYKRMTA